MGKIAFLCGDTAAARHCAEVFTDRFPERVGFVCKIGNDTTKYVSNRNAIKTTCKNRVVPLLQYRSEKRLLELAQDREVTTIVCLWWPHILKLLQKHVINVINTHPSLLPYNRGKYPYYWSIMDGTPFGVTIHRIDNGVDTGRILWQSKIDVPPESTGGGLYHAGVTNMVHLFMANINEIAAQRFPAGKDQNEEDATFHLAKDFDRDKILDLDDYEHIGWLLDDLRARTFKNLESGMRVRIDGKFYRIHLKLVEEE